jgi:DNA-binding CsgD family transcriptional regulator
MRATRRLTVICPGRWGSMSTPRPERQRAAPDNGAPRPSLPPMLRETVATFAAAYALSGRECELIEVAAGVGVSNKQIAARLGCSVRTIEVYWTRVFRKVGLRSRGEILAEFIVHALSRSPEVTAPAPARRRSR